MGEPVEAVADLPKLQCLLCGQGVEGQLQPVAIDQRLGTVIVGDTGLVVDDPQRAVGAAVDPIDHAADCERRFAFTDLQRGLAAETLLECDGGSVVGPQGGKRGTRVGLDLGTCLRPPGRDTKALLLRRRV